MNIFKLIILTICCFTVPFNCQSSKKVISSASYQLAPGQGHYYLIPVKNQEALVTVKNALQTFHKENGYDALGIINPEVEGIETPILVVRGRFAHLNEILPYEEALTPFLRAHQKVILFSSPIALINYQTLILSKDLKGYQRFLSNL